jgi:hypothetical protein
VLTFDDLAVALVLATLNKALIDFLAEPVLRKRPGLDLWWLNYVALVTGVVIAWFAGVDFLSGKLVLATDPAGALTGRILSCITVGAGTGLINRVFVGSNVEAAPQGLGLAAAPESKPKYRGW